MIELLEWPENDGDTALRRAFDAKFMALAKDAQSLVFVPVPSPRGSTAAAIASKAGARVIELPHQGLGWVVPRENLPDAIEPIFAARIPELTVLCFGQDPSYADVLAALKQEPGAAETVLEFEDGELIAPMTAT
ncbi:hypothetical protein [Fulvimarina sp. MAC3]|uniref:hypothetical protein n=1 Tax=Fulvimarina sp. MAC3 TaxID=3148887 RepID=UPI0031FC1087